MWTKIVKKKTIDLPISPNSQLLARQRMEVIQKAILLKKKEDHQRLSRFKHAILRTSKISTSLQDLLTSNKKK